MRRLLPLLLVAAASASAFAQDTTIDPNGTVATVNGEAIKASEYYHRLESFRVESGDPLAPLPVGFQMLREIIGERILLQLAKSKGLLPTAPEIDARVAQSYAENPNLKAQLAETQRNEADLRQTLTLEEARFKLLTAGVTITDQEVEKHYKDYPSEFTEPKRYKLRVIAVTDDAGQDKVDAALKSGQAFGAVAKDMSADPATKSQEGFFGDIPESQLSDTTRAAVSSTPVGATSGWVQPAGSTTRVKFLVEAVTPAHTLPLDAKLKNATRRRMMLDRANAQNSAGQEYDAATRNAVVTIARPGFQKLYTDIAARAKQAASLGG